MNNNSNTGKGKERTMSRNQRFWYIGIKKKHNKKILSDKTRIGPELNKKEMLQ